MSLSVENTVKRILRPWALVTVATASMAAPAIAADTAADNGLAEVVVTAQFRQQNLQDTPIAITAVNAALLESRNQTNLAAVADQAPGVSLRETGGAFGPGMTAAIRGIGQGDFDPAFSPGVGLYIDDVYYTSLTGSNFALVDLDRVEILRGPQGTLSGMNSEGGSIKLFTQKPQGDDTGSFNIGYGSRNLVDLRAVADVSLIPNTLFLRLSGVSRQQDGYVTRLDYGCKFPTSGIPSQTQQLDCVTGHEGGKNYTGGRMALRWLAGDNFEANLTADVTIDKSETAAVTLLAVNAAAGAITNINTPFSTANTHVGNVAYDSRFVPSNPYTSYANFCATSLAWGAHGPTQGPQTCVSPDTYTKIYGTNLTLDWKLGDSLALKSITSFREFHSMWAEDNDVSPMSGSLGIEDLLNHTLSQELRLTGKAGTVLDYSAGAFYLDQVTTYPTHQVLDYVAPFPFEFLGNDPVGEQDYAAFANATWHITDALNFNGGVRYTHENKTYTFTRDNPPNVASIIGLGSFIFAPGFSGAQGHYEGGKVDYRANLDYRWNDELMTYASVSTGFKGGAVNPRPFTTDQSHASVNPETLTAYEVGAKTDFFDRTLRVNVSAFYNKYKDIQLVLLTCPQFSQDAANPQTEPCAAPVNGGDANIYGAELESSYRLNGWTFEANGSKQHFEYTRIDPATGISLGSPEPGFQPLRWNVAAQYEAHLANGATLSPRLDYVYSSSFYTNSAADPYSKTYGYHELNGNLTYKADGDKWELSLLATNLLNKLWYVSTFDLYASSGAVYGTPAAPRNLEVMFKKKF
jgi:iron complex outermembrane receptor protein